MNIISLGAGVQSSTMALMAAHGEITPMPDCAVFADTQAEPIAVYEWLDWLEKQLPFPTYRVSAGNLGAESIAMAGCFGDGFNPIPWYMMINDTVAMGRRECTYHYKKRPIHRMIGGLAGKKRQATTLWIGISTDEAARMKDATVKYILNRWPLIEKGISRIGCLRWMAAHDYAEPPKSSCVWCPYKSNSQWRLTKQNPAEWEKVVRMDEAIRTQRANGRQFIHRSLKPIDKVDFSNDEDRGQLNMFQNECEGMCGT